MASTSPSSPSDERIAGELVGLERDDGDKGASGKGERQPHDEQRPEFSSVKQWGGVQGGHRTGTGGTRRAGSTRW